jgi:hypothetical protein
MKKLALTFSLLSLAIICSNAAVLVVQGKYYYKNLYVLNGFTSNGIGFCTYEVKVNGQITTDEINSSSFEVDFSPFHLKEGSPVTVEIKYRDDGCAPKVVNADVLKSRATFEILSIDIEKNGLLTWTTKDESSPLPYIIEQYRWNKWIKVGEVQGLGRGDQNNYKFQTTLHSGANKFRVRQIGYGAIAKVSTSVSVTSSVESPNFTIEKNAKQIQFTSETLFEVYDVYGNIIKQGYGKHFSIDNLKKGNYYLCYDNITTDFKKK